MTTAVSGHENTPSLCSTSASYGCASGLLWFNLSVVTSQVSGGFEAAARRSPYTPKSDYRDEVMRTCPNFGTDSLQTKLSLGALGLAGESGEAVDLIKKHLHHGKELDRQKLIKEMGDVRWYLEYLAASLGVTMADIEAANIAKTRERYPDGFSYEAANAKRSD